GRFEEGERDGVRGRRQRLHDRYLQRGQRYVSACARQRGDQVAGDGGRLRRRRDVDGQQLDVPERRVPVFADTVPRVGRRMRSGRFLPREQRQLLGRREGRERDRLHRRRQPLHDRHVQRYERRLSASGGQQRGDLSRGRGHLRRGGDLHGKRQHVPERRVQAVLRRLPRLGGRV